MMRAAELSPCGTYRYTLQRFWRPGSRYAMFIGLNPSTADALIDDPTIRRCIEFARSWGYDGFCMVNLFAFRATDPKTMLAANNPIGPENWERIKPWAQFAGIKIAAWGAHGHQTAAEMLMRTRLDDLHCLATNKNGSPAHPLYLPKVLKPVPWKPR